MFDFYFVQSFHIFEFKKKDKISVGFTRYRYVLNAQLFSWHQRTRTWFLVQLIEQTWRVEKNDEFANTKMDQMDQMYNHTRGV